MSITDNMTKEERKEYWELVMEEYADSDLSKEDFCDANDINPSTFNYWENRLEELNESNCHPLTCGQGYEVQFGNSLHPQTHSLPLA